MDIQSITPYCKRLRLAGLLSTLESRINQAREDALPHLEFLSLIF